MKVLLVSSSSGSHGGGEFYLHSLALGLRELGAEVTAWMSDHADMNELADRFARSSLPVVRAHYMNTYHRRLRSVGAAMDRTGIQRITERFRESDADVIHINQQNLEDGLDLIQAASRCGIPAVSTIHVTRTMKALQVVGGRLRDDVSRWIARRSKLALIGISQECCVDICQFISSSDAPYDRVPAKGSPPSGVPVNHVNGNGVKGNGVNGNGRHFNGVHVNGAHADGVDVNGVNVNGLQRGGPRIEARSCEHAGTWSDAVPAVLDRPTGHHGAITKSKRLRVHCVPNGVSRPEVVDRCELRASWGLNDDAMVLGCVARIESQKNPLFVVPLMRQLPEHVHLVWIGDGRLRGELEQRIEAAGLRHRIHLRGWQQHASTQMSGFDSFILPSLYEGLPFAMLEAMAVGLPCVVSDVDGVKDAIEHDVNGLLCPSGDLDAWRNTIYNLVWDAELRARLGHWARVQHENRFSLCAMARGTMDVYQSCLYAMRGK